MTTIIGAGRTLLISIVLSLCGCAVAQQEQSINSTIGTTPEYLELSELRELYAEEDSKFVSIHGMKIHYKDEGQGPVLLMVHGSQSSLHTWDVIVDMLKTEYRIIRYDIPGFGLSGPAVKPGEDTISPEDLAAELLEILGVEKVTAIGTSSGGTLATFLAAEYPDLVERLILSNMPASPVTYDHLVLPEAFKAAQARAKSNNDLYDRDFWKQYHTYFAGDGTRISEKTITEYYDYGRRTPEEYPIGMVAVIGDGVASKEKMAKITQPTLLIWGSSDPLLPRSAAENLEKFLPKADVSRVFLKDVGHYPPLESPIRVGMLMEAFLKTESRPE